MVTIAEVRLGETPGETLLMALSGSRRSHCIIQGPYLPIIGLSIRASILSSMCFCFDVSRNDLFGCLVTLPERSFELAKERFPNILDEERDRSERRICFQRVDRLD